LTPATSSLFVARLKHHAPFSRRRHFISKADRIP